MVADHIRSGFKLRKKKKERGKRLQRVCEYKKQMDEAGDSAQVIEHLPSNRKAPSSIPDTPPKKIQVDKFTQYPNSDSTANAQVMHTFCFFFPGLSTILVSWYIYNVCMILQMPKTAKQEASLSKQILTTLPV